MEENLDIFYWKPPPGSLLLLCALALFCCDFGEEIKIPKTAGKYLQFKRCCVNLILRVSRFTQPPPPPPLRRTSFQNDFLDNENGRIEIFRKPPGAHTLLVVCARSPSWVFFEEIINSEILSNEGWVVAGNLSYVARFRQRARGSLSKLPKKKILVKLQMGGITYLYIFHLHYITLSQKYIPSTCMLQCT